MKRPVFQEGKGEKNASNIQVDAKNGEQKKM